jgi:hypothetical protein
MNKDFILFNSLAKESKNQMERIIMSIRLLTALVPA